jgi:hypothetical protein
MAIRQLPGSSIVANSISTTQLQTTIVNTIEQGGGPRVSSLVYPGNDTAGNTVGGQTVYIVGSGFETNNAIYINGNAVPSKSFISASNLSFTTPALAAGIYPVYVINTDSGATAIFVPGYISSAEPTWVTGSSLSEVNSTDAWNISLSATGDAPITYALAGGSSLPSGISLAANGVISGTLSSPPETDTTYNFTAIATDAQNQDASRQFTITATVGEGLPFANNVLLIHADGTNNQNNHAFLDSSNNNYSITRNGNATQGSFSPFSQTGWSAYFDGDGDFLDAGYNSNFTFGSGNFTIECWVYTQATGTIAGIWDDVSTNPQSWIISSANRGSTTAANINFVIDIAGADTQLMSALQPMNKWFHLAITRSGSSWYMFMDGVQVATATSSATINAGDGSRGLNLGAYNGANQSHKWGMQGYISNFRINKGTALYTSAFTPANSALTAVSGTTLLTCQSNRFIDNSSNNYGLTRNGNISIQAFSPFAPTAAYSTANVGGSVYLDGSGDYLTASNPSMSGTWTVEFWWYPITVASQQTLISFNNGGLTGINMWCNPSAQLVVDDGSNPQSAFTSKLFTANSWNHVAIVKNGSTTTGYINGVAAGSNSFTPQTVSAISIGRYNGSPFYYASGYFSGVRLVQSAVYTGAFTPPTAPPTNIANTAFLCNFTNAGIFDQTAKNVLETVGDAKVSTAQYKYGTGSIAFDGTGDWLVSPVSQNFDFGTGDFTIECWFRLNSLASNYYVIGGNYNAGASDEWLFQVQNNGSIRFLTSADSTFATPSPAITTNTWYHLAATRSGSTVRLFIDGTSIRSYTNANSLGSASKKVYWGIQANESSWPFNGYIDDIRITKGYARYTSNFTPPTSALKDK